jgi:Zn finger protein HypA/HybF involved in hydrogenase expression
MERRKTLYVTIPYELYLKAQTCGINFSQTLKEALEQKIKNLGIEIEVQKEERKNGWTVRCPNCANEFKTLSLFPYCPNCRVHFLILIRKNKQWILNRIVKIPKEVFPIFLEKVKRYYPKLYQKIKDLDIAKILAQPNPQPQL